MSLEDLIHMKKQYEEKIKDTGRQEFIAYLSKFFRLHPTVTAIKWYQYTPYFNDGSECVFGVNEPHVRFLAEEGGDYDDGFFSAWDLRDSNPEIKRSLEELYGKMLELQDLLKIVFEDHKVVTVARDGAVECVSYDHD